MLAISIHPAGTVNSMAKLRVCVLSTLISLLPLGCSSDSQDTSPLDSSSTKPVTLALNWFAEAEHGGYVAAKELGVYAEAGLDVEIRRGGPGAAETVIKELAAGKIEFGISSADLVVAARSRGVPIVALAAPLQHSPRCIMVHESSGFATLEDLEGIELSISDTRYFALWMKHRLPLKNVTIVPFSGSVGEFLLKKDFAQQAYVFSEPFVASEKGSDPQTLMLSDIGYDPYSSILVTTEDVITNSPNLVRAMVRASVDGWERYLADPIETNAAINRDNPEMSLESLAYGVESMKPLCTTEGRLCDMELARWETLVDQIEQIGEIETGSVDAGSCFDNSFLPE